MKIIDRKSLFLTQLKNEKTKLWNFVLKNGILEIDPNGPISREEIDNIKLVFDDINEPYVEDTIYELRVLISRLIMKYRNKDGRYALQMLEFLERLKACFNDPGELIFYALNRWDWGDDEEIQKDIKDFKGSIFNAHPGYLISGTYNHETRTITLYTKNIKDNYESYLSVFAHEYFHAIHHLLLDNSRNRERLSKYYHSVVLESLAVYFEIEYLKEQGFSAKADSKYNNLSKYSPIFDPYSGAITLMKYDNQFHKFNDVLARSLYDFEDALRSFIDPYTADIIISKQNITIELPSNSNSKFPKKGEKEDVIHLYKIKQSQTFDNESSNGYIYSGNHWRMVGNIVKGDIMFHEYRKDISTNIVAISIAKENAYYCNGGKYGAGAGWYVDCQYFILENPWQIDFKHQQCYISKLDYLKATHILENIKNINKENVIVDLISKVVCLSNN